MCYVPILLRPPAAAKGKSTRGGTPGATTAKGAAIDKRCGGKAGPSNFEIKMPRQFTEAQLQVLLAAALHAQPPPLGEATATSYCKVCVTGC